MLCLGPGVIVSSIALCLSYKKLMWAELISHLQLIMMFLMILLVNSGYFFDEVSVDMRQYQVVFVNILYMLIALFVNTSFL